MRVLLSDGSGLTSRQVATRLALAGHTVESLSPDPFCLTRFTRHVKRVHSVPAYGLDPLGWLEAALRVLRAGRHDVLLPTQEQAALLAREADSVRSLGVGLAVPPFDSVLRVQDKLSAFETLRSVGLPQPPGFVARTADELAGAAVPSFVKAPIGTATAGVVHIHDRAELASIGLDGGVLVQEPAAGPLLMVQALFDRGQLVAWHANLRLREGVRGGASHKESVAVPLVGEHLAQLGDALDWHGALSLDAIVTADGPCYIDVNPRLVEPGNAWHSGTDLVGTMLELSLGRSVEPLPPGRPEVRTHQTLLALLGAAQRGGGRRGIVRELRLARSGRGDYTGSVEELTPLSGDPPTAALLTGVGTALVARPSTWEWFSSGSVEAYALTPAAWRTVRG